MQQSTVAGACIAADELKARGLAEDVALEMAARVSALLARQDPAHCWQAVTSTVLTPTIPFAVHQYLYGEVFRDWDPGQGPPPAWQPSPEMIRGTNLAAAMRELGITTYREFHCWSVRNREEFWALAIRRLGLRFTQPWQRVRDEAAGVETPAWLPGARFNIVDSCFLAPVSAPAVVWQRPGDAIRTMTYGELEALTNRVASGLARLGLSPGDAVAVDLPLTPEAVAVYLGTIRAGMAVVSIADSFAADEIAVRLRITAPRLIFTQDVVPKSGGKQPLYAKVLAAKAPRAVVIPASGETIEVDLRPDDLAWAEFLAAETRFASVALSPEATTNVLFSSGTTGEPKAIPWSATTPIKCAVDAHFHHDVRPGDVLTWPTSLGWMMGPWLIYAALVNRATLGLFTGVATGRQFGEFVRDARVTLLGVVPTLVKTWRTTRCLEGLDWSAIKAFSSTGECSNVDDMLYLMALAGYKPVIEYCGGTEIGGAYITGTLVQPASPSTFSTAALGLDFVVLDETGAAADNGEVFLVPPSIGLSNRLLNQDHSRVYFSGCPRLMSGDVLRRHGDQIECLGGGYFRCHGRADDTMKLSGIKVGSAEIERTLNALDGVLETAAVAVVPPGGGPSRLVVFAVLKPEARAAHRNWTATFRNAIRTRLNSMFKVHTVIVVDALPRTASNKVMRRLLRDQYRQILTAAEDGSEQ